MSSTSWREAPGNNFHLTNPINPFEMGMMYNCYNRTIVLAGTCNTGDTARSWRPSIGPDVRYRMLAADGKGADAWWGNTVGTLQDVNEQIMTAVLSNLLAQAGTEPMGVSIQDAEQPLYGELNDQELKVLLGANYFGWVGHYLIHGDMVTPVPGTDLPRAVTVSAHPNPFNPSTEISYSLTRTGPVSLRIYDVAGRLVRTLVVEEQHAGHHRYEWCGSDDNGRRVASGTYLYLLRAEGRMISGKVALVE